MQFSPDPEPAVVWVYTPGFVYWWRTKSESSSVVYESLVPSPQSIVTVKTHAPAPLNTRLPPATPLGRHVSCPVHSAAVPNSGAPPSGAGPWTSMVAGAGAGAMATMARPTTIAPRSTDRQWSPAVNDQPVCWRRPA